MVDRPNHTDVDDLQIMIAVTPLQIYYDQSMTNWPIEVLC